jgi:anti-sigma factor RsiW
MYSLHQRTTELLPWYLSGTLPADERAAVEDHLGSCIGCRAALRDEQLLQQRLVAHGESPASAKHGITSLLTRIDGSAAPARPALRRQRFAYGLLLAVLVISAGWLVPGLYPPGGNGAPAQFATLSDAVAVPGNRIDILFADGVAAGRIEALIEGFGGRRLDGPSELGRYTVVVPNLAPSELDELLAELAVNPEIAFAGRNFIAPAAEDVAP